MPVLYESSARWYDAFSTVKSGDVASYGVAKSGGEDAREASAAAALRIPEDYVHILGDNVRSSVDSRSLGLLPRVEVLGKVAAVIRKPW